MRNIIKYFWKFLPGTYRSDSLKNTIYKFLISYLETLKIKFHKKKIINIIYDFSVSPPTYGDFIYILMVSKYFKLKNYKTRIIIINGEYRTQTWQRIKKKYYNQKVIELKNLAKSFKTHDQIEIKKWKDFYRIYYQKSNLEEFFFKDRVFLRKRIYSHSFNFLNLILKKGNAQFLKKFLLKKNKFNYFYLL